MSKYYTNNLKTEQFIKGQSLVTKCLTHFKLSTERDERSSTKLKGDMRSAYQVPQLLLAF